MAASVLCAAPASDGDITQTAHNLSSSGTGNVTMDTEEVCIFCHTPHRAAGGSTPLWNRDLPPTTYNLYDSTTLEATLLQPTGASRLCLSCHDGLTALSSVLVDPFDGPVSHGPMTGRAKLGTDLADDHPISFVYDANLAAAREGLADPSTLPSTLPLDGASRMQCTTCHEPHQNPYRKFLRVDDRAGGLCVNCHIKANWSSASHATSTATWNGSGTNPWSPASPFTNVMDNACVNCHRPHNAPRPPRLLSQTDDESVCLACHSGNVASQNLEPEFLKPSAHPVGATSWTHEPLENPLTMSRHVSCTDCHNPHQVNDTPGTPPNVPGRLQGVRGLSIAGTPIDEATFTYEVCLKCHGVQDQTTTNIVRLDNNRNIRREIDPSNPSYHPIAAVGKNPNISGLINGYTASSIVTCTDCHGNNAEASGGPDGPHGSQYRPILKREFRQTDPSSESAQAYALCYGCHSRNNLINGDGRFPHDRHLQDANASCAACHDAHGSRQYIRLINFMLQDATGKTVVSPNEHGVIRFNPDLSEPGRGDCSLSCHGKEHDGRNY